MCAAAGAEPAGADSAPAEGGIVHKPQLSLCMYLRFERGRNARRKTQQRTITDDVYLASELGWIA